MLYGDVNERRKGRRKEGMKERKKERRKKISLRILANLLFPMSTLLLVPVGRRSGL